MKFVKAAFAYLIFGLVSGLYFRELTRSLTFEGETVLATLHTHALVLGTMFSLLLMVLDKNYRLQARQKFDFAWNLYQVGVWFLLIMNTVRGTLEVLQTQLSTGIDGMIAGIAGTSHILLSVALVWLMLIIYRSVQDSEKD